MSSPTKKVTPGFLQYLQPEYKDQRDPSALLGEILVLLSQNLRALFLFFEMWSPKEVMLSLNLTEENSREKNACLCSCGGKKLSPFVVIPVLHCQLCVDRTDPGPGHNTFTLGPGYSGCYAALCSYTPQRKTATYRIVSSIQHYPGRVRIRWKQSLPSADQRKVPTGKEYICNWTPQV